MIYCKLRFRRGRFRFLILFFLMGLLMQVENKKTESKCLEENIQSRRQNWFKELTGIGCVDLSCYQVKEQHICFLEQETKIIIIHFYLAQQKSQKTDSTETLMPTVCISNYILEKKEKTLSSCTGLWSLILFTEELYMLSSSLSFVFPVGSHVSFQNHACSWSYCSVVFPGLSQCVHIVQQCQMYRGYSHLAPVLQS